MGWLQQGEHRGWRKKAREGSAETRATRQLRELRIQQALYSGVTSVRGRGEH